MANGRPVGRRYARINDAAAYLDVHPITIRAMIENGRIHAYRYGQRLIRVDLNELDAMMAGETETGTAS
jgi:excisionase family DNA binding protein